MLRPAVEDENEYALMPSVNWDTFAALPGAATTNFEILCRALIRRQYGQFGDFRALANQPGVEFHLKLHSSSCLGDPGRWYGWQCRWYDLPTGRAIGSTRRKKIKEAIDKTKEVLPELTDWVLWTRHPLTANDQVWFYAIKTHMKLVLWTSAEIEDHLSRPAEILRGTYFGELVLTPDLLRDLHANSVAPIKGRWLPEVHQVVEAERELQRALGASTAWMDLSQLASRLDSGTKVVRAATKKLSARLVAGADTIVQSAIALRDSLVQTEAALGRGDIEILRQEFVNHVRPAKEENAFTRRLRAARHVLAPHATNLLADMYGTVKALGELDRALSRRMLAVIGDAGYGKTQLAAQLTSEKGSRPTGILLHGRELHARQNLDDLARGISVNGARVETFEALVAAIDAAGQRAGCRLPIIVDGLNEAEDPRDWKTALASVRPMLPKYPYVLLLCTLRRDFVQEALPEDVEHLELPGFKDDLVEAVKRYFKFYRIDWSDATLHWELFNHPLLLRMFCEVTNPKREKDVGLEAMPTSLTALFDRYLDQVAQRIGELSHWSQRYFESDIRTALNRIGLALWETKARSIDKDELRKLLNDERRPWDQSIVRALEHDGVLIRVSGSGTSTGAVTVVYDMLAGHIVADALLDQRSGNDFQSWLSLADTAARFSMDYDKRHPLADDVFNALVGLCPRRRYRQQLWPLLQEPLRTDALCKAAWLEALYLDGETVLELSKLVAKTPIGRPDLLDRLWMTRAARSHPLDAEFLDSALRAMPLADRDLRWTEWLRRRQVEILENMKGVEERWMHVAPGQLCEKLRARWVMWSLTSTVRLLRDHASRALYTFGCNDPNALFDLTLASLGVNDLYVPERMLAACYGVAMSLWADPQGEAVRVALPEFASALVDRMFVSSAPHGTRHVLLRDYAMGVISLAQRVSPGCITADELRYLAPPFDHLPSPW